MTIIPINKKYMYVCILIAVALCGAQVIGNDMLVLGCLGMFMVLLAWCCSYSFTLPVLLFFLPWSPIMRLSPTSFSFYTFGLVMICLLGVIKKRFSFRQYQIKVGLLLLFLTLLSKLIDGSGLSFTYIAFMMMLILFPVVKEEQYQQKYDFYQVVSFFSLGIIMAALCAMYFAENPNLRQYIRVDSYLTIIRRCGFYGDPNFYVAQILAALAGTLSLILRQKKRKYVLFQGILTMFLLYCGFLSGSKSFALVSAVIMLIWFLSILRMRGRAGLKIVLVACMIWAVIYISTSVLFKSLIDVIITRFLFTRNLNSFTTGRIGLWKSYFEAILSDLKIFFLGKGLTNIKVNGRGSHNSIIQIFYQLGLLGSPVLFYWIACFNREVMTTEKKQKTFALSHLMVFVGVVIPWLAIDILFFDEFFLLQWYMMFAFAQTDSLKNVQNNSYGGNLWTRE